MHTYKYLHTYTYYRMHMSLHTELHMRSQASILHIKRRDIIIRPRTSNPAIYTKINTATTRARPTYWARTSDLPGGVDAAIAASNESRA